MFCGNAKGDCMPPMIIYKAKNVYQQWTENGVDGAKYRCTDSGWFNGPQLADWNFEVSELYLFARQFWTPFLN